MRAGNSPVQIHKDQLEELVPAWYDLALKFHKDPRRVQGFRLDTGGEHCVLVVAYNGRAWAAARGLHATAYKAKCRRSFWMAWCSTSALI